MKSDLAYALAARFGELVSRYDNEFKLLRLMNGTMIRRSSVSWLGALPRSFNKKRRSSHDGV